jgi:predicted transcriptional regulator
MEKLVRQMQEDETKQASVDCHLTDLEMLGSEIWKDVNIDEFVQEERQWD